ncbi:MAG TPA: RNA polymerase sigma factor SigZ [Verrucomicrobiae bacterium]|nr:RNA polymerase sigma factor SigZ [Verrucomicrobiae bacterium]
MTPTVENIWTEFADRLGQFIRSRVSDRAAADDILQDVFLKVQKNLGQLDDPAKLQSWLYLIARNAIIDHYRTKKETTQIPESLPAEDDGDNDPEIEGLKAAFRRMVYSLPDPYRDAIVLTEFEGVSQKELAQRLGISISGAKSRVQRGRALLKRMLVDCCQLEFDRRGSVIDCNPRVKGNCPECQSS